MLTTIHSDCFSTQNIILIYRMVGIEWMIYSIELVITLVKLALLYLILYVIIIISMDDIIHFDPTNSQCYMHTFILLTHRHFSMTFFYDIFYNVFYDIFLFPLNFISIININFLMLLIFIKISFLFMFYLNINYPKFQYIRCVLSDTRVFKTRKFFLRSIHCVLFVRF